MDTEASKRKKQAVTTGIRNLRSVVGHALPSLDSMLAKQVEGYRELLKMADSLPSEHFPVIPEKQQAKFTISGLALMAAAIQQLTNISIALSILVDFLSVQAPSKEDVNTLRTQLERHEETIKSMNDLVEKKRKEQEALREQFERAKKIYG